jgi:hypothetical protein
LQTGAPPTGPDKGQVLAHDDPRLAAVNAAWPALPEAVRQSIMMLVTAAAK